MEDEDEVPKVVTDLPHPSSEQQLSEPHAEEPEVSAQCDAVSKVEDFAKPPPLPVEKQESPLSPVVEAVEKENEVENVKELISEVEDMAPAAEESKVKEEETVAADGECEEMAGEQGEELVKAEDKGEEEMAEEEEVQEAEDEAVLMAEETETESETVKSGSGRGGKRGRGRSSKSTPVRAPTRKTAGEDVCFICLDGGDLVLCDRRGCPKAYHPSCVDHDDEFFKSKGRWNCGWHLCNQCGKNAYFMCYTCTFSLCKGCSKDAVVYCLRGNKGFCETCMKTVLMIESSEQNEMGQVTFDDNSSWEYLFKDYWMEQKGKLSITSDELVRVKNSVKNADGTEKQQTSAEVDDDNDDIGTDSDNSLENLEVTDSRRKKAKRKSKPLDSDTDSSLEKYAGIAKRKAKRKSLAKEAYSDSEHSSGNQDTSNKRGKRARRLSKSRSKDGYSASAGAAANHRISAEGDIEWASTELLEFVMHMRNGDKSVLTQFDVQGLLLEYIKRNKLRDPRRQSQIICDSMLQKLFGKPRVGHFEMLKLLESHFLLKEHCHADNNQGIDTEISQLDADDNIDSLLDAGRSRGRKSRKRGEERRQSNLDDYAAIDMHNIKLIYLRRNLMEALMDDSEMFHDKVVGSFVRIRISGSSQKQDIYRLVQIIGTSKVAEPYKVGKRTTDVMLEILNLDKTEIISIDIISNQEFTEDECKRLRQSIKCGLISRMTVGDVLEKARELQEVRVTDWLEAETLRLSHLRDRASEKGRKKELRECVEKLQLLKSPEERQRRLNEIPEVHADPKMDPSCESDEENEKASNMRSRESGFFRRGRDSFSSGKGGSVSNDSWSGNARSPNKKWETSRSFSGKGFSSRETTIVSQTGEHTWNDGVDKRTPRSNSWEKPRITSDPLTSPQAEYSRMRSDMPAAAASESSRPLSTAVGQSDGKVDETEKMWHYRDPTGKVQGPFSMVQLRKWNNTGYFPADLKIWRLSQSEDDSILLPEALAGRFEKELPSVGLSSDVGSKIRNVPSSIDTSKLSGGRYDSSNLPSPTPARSPAGWSGKQTSSNFQSTNQFRGGNERLPSPTPLSSSSDPSSVGRSNLPRQSKDGVAGNKQENVAAATGTAQPSGQYFSIPGPRPDVSLNSGAINSHQVPSQSSVHVANQPFTPPNNVMNQTNSGPNASGTGQGFSNVVQPGTGQNPAAYGHGWVSGYVARPEIVNANLTSNNLNAVTAQVAYGQWPAAPVNNQALSYGAGYPPGPGNMTANFPAMPFNNAWRPAPTNMPWAAQQQQPVNQNMGWAGAGPQPGTAFGPPAGPVGQLAGPTPGTAAVPVGNPNVGWAGTGPNPSAGSTNPGWVAQPGNSSTRVGDQNRNGGGAQWNRQPSFGSGGQRVCKFHENGHCRKGSSCDFMHT